VQWEGIPATGNTWEPIEHLDGEEAAEKVQEFEKLREEQTNEVRFIV
jgi:hypothetical protein